MNTRQAAEFVSITYRQLDYLISQGVISPTGEYGQGKAREFTRRDLALLWVVALLRADGYRIEALKEAVSLINQYWLTDDWKDAGTLLTIYKGNPKYAMAYHPGGKIGSSGWPVNTPTFGGGRGDYFIYVNRELFHPFAEKYTNPPEMLPACLRGFNYTVKLLAKEVYQELDKLEP